MYFEAVFSFYVLLYHFVGHSFLGLVLFGSFSDIIKRNFSLTFAKLNFYVDMSVWLFVGKQYYRLNELQVCLAGDPDDRRGFKTIYTGPAHFHGEVTWNIPGMNIGYGELKSIESYEFIKAVVEGRQPSTSFAEGYRVERVCDAVKRSAETGRWVTVND